MENQVLITIYYITRAGYTGSKSYSQWEFEMYVSNRHVLVAVFSRCYMSGFTVAQIDSLILRGVNVSSSLFIFAHKNRFIARGSGQMAN